MALTEILGYAGAIAIGFSLGLIGGGGSILTVPVLVYLMNTEPVLATAYSLFVVGISALVGGITYIKDKLVDFRTAIVFGIPSIVTVFLVRMFLMPAIPDELFEIAGFVLTKSLGIMVLFAVLMIAASYSMIRTAKKPATAGESDVKITFNYPLILAEGAVVGVLTGLVGAGGGFLIIPALVLLAKLPMKKAVGTSLLIIAAKSLIGFIGDVVEQDAIDWQFLLVFSSIAVGGIFIGSYTSRFIDGNKLKKVFGYFTLLMGIFILLQQSGVIHWTNSH